MTTDQILRTDKLGRVVMSRERKTELLAQYDQSGMSGKRFAQWAGVNYQTLASWLCQRRKNAAALTLKAEAGTAAEPVRWLEAVVKKKEGGATPQPKNQSGLVVWGPGGMWLEITHEEQARLAALFWHELAKAGPC